MLVVSLLSLVVPFVISTGRAQELPIKHLVFIIQENHTFDNYFGTYPGANGLSGIMNATLLREAYMSDLNPATPAIDPDNSGLPVYDASNPNGFEINRLPVGYYDNSDIPYYWDYASHYVLCDNFFSSEFAPTFPNHLFIASGAAGPNGENDSYYSRNGTFINNPTDLSDLDL